MKTKCLFLLLLLLSAAGLSAQAKLDSLRRDLADPKIFKGLTYSKLSAAFSTNTDSAVYYGKKGVEAVTASTSAKDKIEIYAAYASALNNAGKTQEALRLNLQNIGWAEELGDSVQRAKVYNSTGKNYSDIGSYDAALNYYEQARKIREKLKDITLLAGTLTLEGVVYNEKGDYEKAQQVLLRALGLYEKAKDMKGKARVYNNLGSVYINQQSYEDALRYYRLSLETKIKAGADIKDQSFSSSNVGVAYYNLNMYDSALHYYNIALNQKLQCGELKGVATAYNNIALIYRGWKKYADAEDYLLKALKIRRDINDNRGIASSCMSLASVYSYMGRYMDAIRLFEEAQGIAEKIEARTLLVQIYEGLSDAYGSVGNYQKAYVFDTLCRNVNDELTSAETRKIIAEMKSKYENEVQTRKISELEQDKRESQLLQAATAEKQRARNYMIIAAAVLLVLVLVFVLLRYRENQRSKLRLQAAFDEIDSKNKDITSSIRYAQRIQQAALPEPHELTELFPDSFVLFRPKDIVSGDFYWVSSTQDKSLRIIAVADCTGHGVPGAFMSLVGTDYLNQSVKNPEVQDCSSALHFLDAGIIRHLKQGGETENKDGMDIALCAWSPAERTLMYAGAFRPLLLIRDGHLEEISASRFSIGGAYTDKKQFVNHRISLKPGDCFYIFTDGFADQFGGPQGKKFMSKQLKDLLLAIHREPMEKQRRLLEERFDSWRGPLEQTDDVCVAGVRVS